MFNGVLRNGDEWDEVYDFRDAVCALVFRSSESGEHTVLLNQHELRAGQVHAFRAWLQAQRPGERISYQLFIKRWDDLLYHESMDPEDVLESPL